MKKKSNFFVRKEQKNIINDKKLINEEEEELKIIFSLLISHENFILSSWEKKNYFSSEFNFFFININIFNTWREAVMMMWKPSVAIACSDKTNFSQITLFLRT